MHSDDKEKNLLKLIVLCFPVLAVHLIWSLEYTHAIDRLKSIGLPSSLLFLFTSSGPLSGFFVQPIIGSMSDQCLSKFGRRRPFILGGMMLTIISLIVFGFGVELGALLHLSNVSMIAIIILFIYILNFGLNVITICGQSLIVDQVTTKQQKKANNIGVLMGYMGNIVGYLLSSIDFKKFKHFDNNLHPLVLICILMVISTTVMTCVSTTEKIHKRKDPEQEQKTKHVLNTVINLKKLFIQFKKLPHFIYYISMANFFATFGTFPFMFYSIEWLSNTIEKNPYLVSGFNFQQKADYKIRTSSTVLAFSSLVSVLSLIVFPYFIKDINKEYTNLNTNETSIVNQKFKKKFILRVFNRSKVTLLALLSITLLMNFFLFILGVVLNFNIYVCITVVILEGFPLAVIKWVTFSTTGEYISYQNSLRKDEGNRTDIVDLEVISNKEACFKKYTPKNVPMKFFEKNGETDEDELEIGAIFGISNLFIVVPQIIINLLSFGLFQLIDVINNKLKTVYENYRYYQFTGFDVMFFVGGILSILAFYYSYKLWKK